MKMVKVVCCMDKSFHTGQLLHYRLHELYRLYDIAGH